jgi:nicotinamide phosphoribosyltransferase
MALTLEGVSKMTNVLNLLTAIIRTDSYKLSQWMQYPKDTVRISSYIESRGGEDQSVFFGLQAFIKQYMMTPITMADINRAELIVKAHGLPFNREGWEIIVNEYGGMLPLEIEAVPEGTVMETRNIQVQIVNTDSRLFWLTSYVETAMLRGIWYPSTVATKSRKMKKIIAAALHKTSDVPVADQIMFKLHDFGARGASSSETAMLGGMGHLINFMGTDTVEALVGAMEYYNTDAVPGFSIPASEHSTITSWGGPEGEVKAFENMINTFAGEGKLYACVSDSYDIYAAARDLWGGVLKDRVISAGGTLVVRPDSGDPETVPVEVIGILMDRFGFTINSKGYKVLPPYVRLIQGDGINEHSLPRIVDNMIAAGYSIDNIAFGMGGGLLQAWNRDTLKYAMKASAREDTAGVWHDVFKDPISDRGKVSKKGRLGLIKECGIGSCGYKTVAKEIADQKGNLLRTVYRDGKLLVEDTFETIRDRAAMKEDEYVTKIIDRF